MKMGMRILSVLAVVVLLTGCGTDKSSDQDNMNTSGQMSEAPVDGMGGAVDMAGNAAPGTQQDLVVNVGDRVFFGYDKYDLTTDARMIVEKQAAWLKKYPHLNISVEGHCDERGTREYNLALGEKRAMTVRNYLIALGVESGRVQTISYGKERPAQSGSDEDSWAQNRRGVVVVQ